MNRHPEDHKEDGEKDHCRLQCHDARWDHQHANPDEDADGCGGPEDAGDVTSDFIRRIGTQPPRPSLAPSGAYWLVRIACDLNWCSGYPLTGHVVGEIVQVSLPNCFLGVM